MSEEKKPSSEPMELVEEECSNCMYVFKATHGGIYPQYYCRRFPPTHHSPYPVTYPEGWCGEYCEGDEF